MGMNVVAKIRQATRKNYTAEEKIRIVLEEDPWGFESEGLERARDADRAGRESAT